MVVLWLMYIAGRPSYGILKASWSCNCVMYSLHVAWNFYISLNSRSRSNSKLKEFISPWRWITHLLRCWAPSVLCKFRTTVSSLIFASSTQPFARMYSMFHVANLIPFYLIKPYGVQLLHTHVYIIYFTPMYTSSILQNHRFRMHFFPSLLPVCYDVPFFRDLHPLYKLSLRNCVVFLLRHILAPTHFSMAKALVNCCRISYINSPW